MPDPAQSIRKLYDSCIHLSMGELTDLALCLERMGEPGCSKKFQDVIRARIEGLKEGKADA